MNRSNNFFIVTQKMIERNIDIFETIDDDINDNDKLSVNIFVDNLNSSYRRDKMITLRVDR